MTCLKRRPSDDRPGRLFLAVAPLPDLLLSPVDHPIQSFQGLGVEAAQEVSGCRRVRNQVRSEHPPDRFTGLEIRDVFDTRPPGVQVVDVGQNVVRLVEGAVRGEQGQLAVQIPRDVQTPNQAHCQGQTPVGRRVRGLTR